MNDSLKELAAKAAKQLLAPVLEADEREGRFRPELIAELGKLGLTGIPTPTGLGGAGLGFVEYAAALEEIAAVSVAYTVSIAVTGLTQVILTRFGSEEQRRRHVPGLAEGRHIGAFALTESHSGSDAAALRARAVRKGREYVITGTKLFITQANLAECLIVFARTGEPGPKGISAFLVEKGAAGLRVAKTERKMGIHISPTCELILEDVKVPATNVIGGEGGGFCIAMAALDSGRITMGATSVGLARAAFDFAVDYARGRSQFSQPIIDFQGIQFMLADMHVAIEASRLLVQNAARLRDEGAPHSREAAAAKLFASDSAMRVTTDAVQILGGAGYMQDYPVERYMREAKALQIVEGTNQIQRVVIARSLGD